MGSDAQRLSRFAREIDPAILTTDPVTLAAHAYDATNEFFFPEAVVRPRQADDLRAILTAANAHGMPLIPRGAGTGFSGGSLPVGGGVVLDFLGMNRILSVDADALTALVEPGVITLQLQEAAERNGLFYPPDPASMKTCTIGGNVAENAGGPRCLKYGVTRDYVLVIEGFTGAGNPLTAGKNVLKNRAGYDLRHLLIGSEGTLAVFSRFLVRLIPKPEAKILFLAFFREFDAATGMVHTLLHRGLAPSSMEFMDEFAIRAVEAHAKLGLPTNYQALLLIEVDGRSEEMAALRQRTEECLASTAAEVRIALSPAEQESLWDVRRKTSPALRAFGNKKANEDIVVPRRNIPATIRGLRLMAEELRLNVISFGHIGDGNIHVNIMYDQHDPAECSRVEVGIDRIFELVNRFEGAVSGEHGIGIAKKRYLPANLDPTSYDLMRSIKKVFDPRGILNPHKMFY